MTVRSYSRPLALVLALAGVVLSSARAQETAAATTYALEAADGVPGAFSVDVTPDRPGTWTVTVAWTGRGLCGLRVEQHGRVLGRTAGASPLALEITAGDGALAVGEAVRVRFAPLTARGALAGTLRVDPPAPPPRPEPPAAPKPASTKPLPTKPPRGPAACVAPLAGDDPVGRAARDLGAALESASPETTAWVTASLLRVTDAVRRPEDERGRRAALDDAWEILEADPGPDPAARAAVRQAAATVQDLTRRVARGQPNAAARRDALVDAFACIAGAAR